MAIKGKLGTCVFNALFSCLCFAGRLYIKDRKHFIRCGHWTGMPSTSPSLKNAVKL